MGLPVKEETEESLGMDIALDLLLFLLEIAPKHLFTTDQCYVMHNLLMVARKTTINWMKSIPLTIDQWLQKVKLINMMDHMT